MWCEAHLSPDAKKKILHDNAAAFCNLTV
jgi:predicted TIM-barrel fold metal-dependent hydrolase